jgi:UDP-N-acetylmuramoylalanine--D-glutamate ligase
LKEPEGARRGPPLDDLLPLGLDLTGRRVLVLGLGITGREVAKVLRARGADVLVSDVATPSTTELESDGVEVETGGHDRAAAELDSFDFVFPSPGISPLRGFLAEAIARGVPIVSELEIGARMTDAPIVAVTGTNGKTTVCRIAELIGREASMDVYACGNLETKFVTAAHEHPDADAFVVEASSFSLAFCETFHPRVAIVTSLAADHLDWHGTLEHYRDAKARIARNQREGELYLYPARQPELAEFAPADGPLRVPFAIAELSSGGAWLHGNDIVVSFDDRRAQISGGAARIAARGRHFGADAAAAAAAMMFLGAGVEAVAGGLRRFDFDPHRLDPVGELNGVRLYDDSVATNTEATLAALSTFEVPVILIAGGRNKAIDLGPLAAAGPRLRAVITLGEAAAELEAVFTGTGVFVSNAGSMREAVAMAMQRARTGDVILLSPACASHDMFTNYAERGRAFQEACRELGVA